MTQSLRKPYQLTSCDATRARDQPLNEAYQLTIREFLEKDVEDPEPQALTQSYVFPKKFGVETPFTIGRRDSCTIPDLDESAEFRDVRLYLAQSDAGS